jgi:hypothetical protein
MSEFVDNFMKLKQKQYSKEYYKKNKEKIDRQNKAYRQVNAKKIKAYRQK